MLELSGNERQLLADAAPRQADHLGRHAALPREADADLAARDEERHDGGHVDGGEPAQQWHREDRATSRRERSRCRDSLEDVGVDDRQDHQEADDERQPVAARPHEHQDDEADDGRAADRREQRGQQRVDDPRAGRQGRAEDADQRGQQETR